MSLEAPSTSYPAIHGNGVRASPPGGRPSFVSPARRAEQLWAKWEESGDIQNGRLPRPRVRDFLLALQLSEADVAAAMQPLEGHGILGSDDGLTYEQALALCSALEEPTSPTASSSSALLSSLPSASGLSKAPFKKILSKNRDYLGTGHLVYDEAVVAYMRKLEEHRRKCEADKRYAEAKAAAERLADLKTAQVVRLRQELVVVQTRELAEVQRVYEEETRKFFAVWEGRIVSYEASFGQAVEELRQVQQQQGTLFARELSKKMSKPRPSREYLNLKKMEESLCRAKEYTRAAQMQRAAQSLMQGQVEQAQMAQEADNQMKVAKVMAKQRLEADALTSRGVRGRDELELRRATETEKRTYRFRNVVMELESLHRLEIVSLENFLDGQVQAGKAVPLKDGFRRKREQVLSTAF